MSSVQKKISKKNSKLDNKNPPKKTKSEKDLITPEKKITNEPIEKEMLKGQEHNTHIEEVPKEEKNENENKEEINDKEQENSQNDEKQEENQEQEVIQVKPRESYLKEKIMKLNFNEKLISNINKSLDTEVQKIKEEIIDEQILITAVPKVFDTKKFERKSNPELEQKKIYEKSNFKIFKELK